jgi:hypothetical protein
MLRLFSRLLPLLRHAGAPAAVCVAAACVGCAGYQIGHHSLFPRDVKTVYVPIFESDSFRRYLGERLTEAVVKRIEDRSGLKVVSDATSADTILAGRIVDERKGILVETRNDDPRQIETTLVVRVRWTRRDGSLIGSDHVLPVAPELVQVNGVSALAPEVGQSVATAHQQAIDRIAVQIVELMEMPW